MNELSVSNEDSCASALTWETSQYASFRGRFRAGIVLPEGKPG